jgi:tetratricopeptide (TPR) repeat protein
MKEVALTLALFLISGCAVLRSLPFTEDAKRYQVAQTYFDRGNYKAAYEAYRVIADSRSPWAEEAKFNAAYALVYHKNPQKNYASAELEFDEFLSRYPRSAFIGEATTWSAMLKMFHQTKAGELAKEVDVLTAKVENLTNELRKNQGENVGLRKEREALLSERTALLQKIDGLLNEKEALIGKNVELAKDKEGLTREKTGLTKKVDMLSKEKAKLLEAKAALEKSLRDLTMVDVKMERQRKKIKTEEHK